MRAVLAAATVLLCACGRDAAPPVEPVDDPIDVQAFVNIQLGDTPAGQQPFYIITGQARATRNGVQVNAKIDSVLVYRDVDGSWVRVARSPGVPFSGTLPDTAHAGVTYTMMARLHATGWVAADIASAMAERTAAGAGY